jgi:hypothetical protein
MRLQRPTLLRYPRLTFKTDHRRAIDRYINFFGDRAAPGTEPGTTRVPSVDARPSGGRGQD